jgi:large subunit ribosomal protein L32
MANPKYKTPKSKSRRRRSHLHLQPASLSVCPKCKEKKMPHRICPSCGAYKGRDVITLKEEK